MNPDRWRQIKDLLVDLRDLSPDRRRALLDERCGHDPSMRAEVESLLVHAERSAEFLEPAGVETNRGHVTTDRAVAGHRVGRFVVQRVLGRGAMGIVYEARQENPSRHVALKVIRGRHYIDDRHVRLFEREVQALARLDHPGIASIYEAGCTDDGEHYFAMELIDGRSLTTYASDGRLSTQERIRLFLEVCDAILYAHQRGVIHRDLKPGNILVGAPGRPKVLDFGLARITESDIQATMPDTELGRIQGTLAYMSPEQAGGDPSRIDLRSDVYSLGVILYELLTDRLPHDTESASLPEAIRLIRDEPPRRPSTICRALRGDLETIVLKALEKDPERRYATVEALADDLCRHLDSLPILARPPSTIYHLRMFAKRNRGLVAGVMLAMAVLIAGTAGMTVLMLRAQRAETEALRLARLEQEQRAQTEQALDRATTEAAKATQVQDFLLGMLAAADPAQRGRPDVTVRDMLDLASRRINMDPADQPEVRAALDTAIGASYRELGLYESALTHLQRALETNIQLFGERSPPVAESLRQLASAHLVGSQYILAEQHARQALDIMESAMPEELARHAELNCEVGYALQYQGKLRDAQEQYERAIDLYRRVGDTGPGYLDAQRHLALVERAFGRHAEAEQRIRQVLTGRRALSPEGSAATAQTLNSLGTILESQGKLAEAEEVHRETLAMRTKVYGPDHPILAESLNNLGMVLEAQNRLVDAANILNQAVLVRRKCSGPDHPLLAISLNNLALVYARQDDHDRAMEVLNEAIVIKRKRVGEVRPESMAYSLNLLGKLQLVKGDAAAAEVPFREARALFLDAFGPDDTRVAVAESGLAHCAAELGRPDEARELLAHSVPILERTFGVEHERSRPARELLTRLSQAHGP